MRFRDDIERQKSLLFVALSFFCLGLPRIVTNAAGFALFVNAFGAAQLPWTYLAASVLGTAVGWVYLKAQRRLDFWIVLLGALTFDLLVLSATRVGLAVGPTRVWIAILTVWVEAEWMIAGLVFWGLAERMFDLRQAKRLFGFVGGGESAAVIGGGVLVNLLLKFIGTPDLLLLSIAAQAASIVLILLIRRGHAHDLQEEEEEDAAEGDAQAVPPGSFGRFRSLVVAIFAVTFLAEAVHFFVDNAFYDSAGVAVPERDALAGFIGWFFTISGVLQLLLGVWAAPALLRRFGAGAALATLPLMCGATALLAVLAAPAGALMLLAAVCLVKLMDEALRHGLYASGLLVMFQPLPPEARTRAHAMNGSYIEQITAGVSGLCLLVLTYFDLNRAWILAAVTAAICVAWFIATRALHRQYLDALRRAFERRAGTEARELDPEAARTVALRLLDSPHPGTVAHALSVLGEGDGTAIGGSIATLLSHPSVEVRRAALELVRVHRLIEARPALLERLASHVGGAEEGAALCALAALDGAAAIERLILFLDNPDPELRISAFVALMTDCGEAGVSRARPAFDALLGMPDPEVRGIAARVLQRAPRSSTSDVARLLDDPVLALRRAALAVARRDLDPALEPRLFEALAVPATGSAAAAALATRGTAILPRLARLHDTAETASSTRCRIAWVMGSMHHPAAVEFLIKRASTGTLDERNAIAEALAAASPRLSPRDAEGLWPHALDAAAWTGMLAALATAWAANGGGALREALQRARDDQRERLLRLLAVLLPHVRIARATLRLQYGEGPEQAVALETIDALLPPRHRTAIMGALDPEAAPPALTDDAATRVAAGENGAMPSWLRALAVRVSADHEIDTAQQFQQWSRDPDALVAATARAILSRSAGDKNGATSLMSMLAIERFMILRSVAMFSDMPGDALLDLVQLLREEEVDAGRVVIREDDYGSRLYIAVSGRYRVSRAGTLLAELGERSVFGELALLDPERRSATVEAIEDGLLFTLDHEDFQEALAGSIQLAQSVIRMLCRRLRDTGARISVSADSARPASGLAS